MLTLCFVVLAMGATAQPREKWSADAPNVLRAAERALLPYSQDLFEELVAVRSALEHTASNPDAQGYGSAALDDMRYAIQSRIFDHTLAMELPFQSEKDALVARFLDFQKHSPSTSKIGQRQAHATQEIHAWMEWELKGFIQSGNGLDFLENPLNQSWYTAVLGNSELDKRLQVIDLLDDLSEKRDSLRVVSEDLQEFCDSPFSSRACDAFQTVLIDLQQKLNEKAREDSLDNLLRQRTLAHRLRDLEWATQMNALADSLFEQEDWSAACSIYARTQHVNAPSRYNLARCTRAQQMEEDARKKASIHARYLFDQQGRLRVDTTLRIGLDEARHIKDLREQLSAQLVASLHAVDLQLAALHRGKGDYAVHNQLTYQVKHIVKHLYTVVCDSSGIVSIEHTLIGEQNRSAYMSDSLIRRVIPDLYPLLRVADGELHEYILPVLHIPYRHKRTKTGSYYCNCHFTHERVSHMYLHCANYASTEVVYESFAHGLRNTQLNSPEDEFFFVVTDGHPESLGPSNPRVVEPREHNQR